MDRRILIVDDSAFARRKLRQILEGAGYTVQEVASGAEALETYAVRKPDAVLLDIVMEGMDGLEVLAQLHAIDPDARIVIASADVQSATRDEAFKLGAIGVVNKPFNTEEVLAAAQRAVESGTP